MIATRHALARFAPAALIVLGSCTDAAGENDDASIDELPRSTVREELRIGDAHDPDIGFTRIAAVAVDADGNTYVAESGENHVRVYDPAGQRIQVIGRQGEGPGEFQSVMYMGVIGDTLWVGDLGNHRVTLFSREGRVIATLPAPEHVFLPQPGWQFRIMGTTYRGGGRLGGNVWLYGMRSGMEGQKVAVPRLVFDSTGAIVDTVGFQHMTMGSAANRVKVGARELFLPRIPVDTLHVLAENGRYVITRPVAATDDEADFLVTHLGPREDTVFIRRYRYRPVPFEDWYLDSMATRFAARYRGSANIPREAVEAAVREHVTLPAFQPPVAHAQASQDGGLWLRRTFDYHPVHRWVLLDAEGAPRGQVELPSNAIVQWSRGDTFWAVIPDELDVPWLVRYRIVPQ